MNDLIDIPVYANKDSKEISFFLTISPNILCKKKSHCKLIVAPMDRDTTITIDQSFLKEVAKLNTEGLLKRLYISNYDRKNINIYIEKKQQTN
jgi:hypothetical protein